MRPAVIEAVYDARPRVHKHAGTRHDLGILRSPDWYLDHINAEESCVLILVRRASRAPGKLFALSDKRGSRHIDVNIIFIVWVDYQGVRVRPAAGLNGSHLLRIRNVRNIEDPYTAEPVLLSG